MVEMRHQCCGDDTLYHVQNHITDYFCNSMELSLSQVYHKVSSFLYILLLYTYSLQYKLALSVSDAC